MGTRTRASDPRRGWQQWTESDARAALAEHARSGKSAAEFCRINGYSTQRLRFWAKRLSRASTVSFVSVELARPPSTRSSSALSGSSPRGHVEMVCDGVVVRVREDLDVEHVARIAIALVQERARRC